MQQAFCTSSGTGQVHHGVSRLSPGRLGSTTAHSNRLGELDKMRLFTFLIQTLVVTVQIRLLD